MSRYDVPRPKKSDFTTRHQKLAGRGTFTNFDSYGYNMAVLRWEEGRDQHNASERASRSGGTMNSTAFRERQRTDGSGKTDVWFNGPGDGNKHGHVVQKTNPDGSTRYIHARDVERNEYDVDGE